MGNTIGIVLISYDVNHSHSQVKAEMEKLDYYDNWKINNGPTHQMPNTTLWHKTKSSDMAIHDLKIVCRNLNVTLEKAVAVLAKEFAGI